MVISQSSSDLGLQSYLGPRIFPTDKLQSIETRLFVALEPSVLASLGVIQNRLRS